MNNYIKLFRVHHILAYALLLCCCRYFILIPILESEGFGVQLSDGYFLLMTLSVILIAAGGYAINDYFNLKSDEVNKPNRVVVGRRISRSKAIMLHLILSGLGILLFFVFAWLIQQFILGILGLLAVGLIWFYSKQYKYQLLIGNIVLALLAVSPFFLVTMTEPSFMEQLTGSNTYVAFNAIRIFLMYALFVFLLSFVLSIIKDIEDMDGDKLMQGTTLPLSIGLKQSLLVVAFVLLMLMGIMVYVLNLMYSGGALIQLGYTVTLLFIPLLLAFILCFTSTNLSEVSKIKRILTLLVYSGILSIPVVYYF